MNNIKITVEYETPKTDKFSELLEQYNNIKKLSDETVSYYKPLADAGCETKMELIIEQLATIQGYLTEINELTQSNNYVFAFEKYREAYYYFKVWGNKIEWGNSDFTKERYLSSFENSLKPFFEHIIMNWDEFKIYESLEKQCIDKLTKLIDNEKARAEKQIKRYENITK